VVKNVKESFAFIRPQAGGNDVFVHHSAVPAKNWPLRTGQLVEYAIGPGKKPGEVRAKDVVVVG
jgi:cold shock CspA family protein